jgi:starch synthase (maltosyl-transferring)
MRVLQTKRIPLRPARVVIDRITPAPDNGRFAARCCQGRPQTVEAVILCDGHEILKADLLFRHEGAPEWERLPMRNMGNDIYRASMTPDKPGTWFYTVEAAIDRYESWRAGFLKKLQAGEAAMVDLQAGLALAAICRDCEEMTPDDLPSLQKIIDDEAMRAVLRADWPESDTVRFSPELPLAVDPPRACFSSWYEFFPRSRWTGIAEQGTLRDAADRLSYIADMGFDVVYLPPLHPIGEAFRKGRNNAARAGPGDQGSPWAIGGKAGGHKAIDPALGTFADFTHLRDRARGLGMDIALDIAFQCAPDHPYVMEHPEWFRKRPDGSIQYAENPPKKYQDIYPFDFETPAWQSLWEELKSVFLFWAEKGVRIFRVDNPHTKAFAFWEWVLREVRRDYPDCVFLAEAFTRPHVMAYLAKIGFSQSYTYFAWRRDKAELTAYLEELAATDLKYYLRPTFWPNTPDILTLDLQTGGRPMYAQRLVLAATLSSNYGIYGPAFELMDSAPLIPGKEEYLNAEKYEVKVWDVARPDSLAPLIKRVNKIRRENAALHGQDSLMFHPVSNDRIIAYTKQEDKNLILTVVNLDAQNRQAGIVDLQIQKLGISPSGTYLLDDLLNDARYTWTGWRNYVELDPHVAPAHVFRVSQASGNSP